MFSKKELLAVSPEGFEECLKHKILSYRQPLSDVERIHEPHCQHGCTLTAVERGASFEAVCLDHPEEDPIPIDKDDLNRYTFSIENFLERIRIVNNIEGTVHEIGRDHYELGAKDVRGTRVEFFYAQNMKSSESQLMTMLKNDDSDVWIILSPVTKVKAIDQKNALLNEGIVSVSLLECMDLTTFKLPIDQILSGLPKEYQDANTSKPKLTPKQDADYQKYGYKCYDRLEFLEKPASGRKLWVRINSDDLEISYNEVILLMFLAKELKHKKGCWVNVEQLVDQFVNRNEADVHRTVRDVRKGIKNSLKNKNVSDFIENDRKGKYRISTHPDFIKAPTTRWLSDRFEEIKQLVIAERKRRKAWDSV